MENVKKFYEALAKDEAMKKRAMAQNEKYKGGKPDEAAVHADILAFAKAEGYSFTLEDLDAYAKQVKPLADEQLEAVAGGGGGCGCAGWGGGGGTAKNGLTFTCVCYMGGLGTSDAMGTIADSGFCTCVWAGGGGA